MPRRKPKLRVPSVDDRLIYSTTLPRSLSSRLSETGWGIGILIQRLHPTRVLPGEVRAAQPTV